MSESMTSRGDETVGSARRLLLIGDAAALSTVSGASDARCEVRAGALDGIDAAGRGFSVIAVVAADMAGRLASVLRGLREADKRARLVILARMFEEPQAARLVQTMEAGRPLADDYVILPTSAAELLGQAEPGQESRSRRLSDPARMDTRRADRMKELERLATQDDLTGLKNRRYIREFGRQIIDLAAAEGGRVTLLVFDIDDFKHYNDVYGHPTGDKILREAASLMTRCCREHDVVGRIGGDEFAVIFWDDPRAARGGAVAERRSRADHPREPVFIAQRFQRELERSDLGLLGPRGKGELTISGGLASFPRDGDSIGELFQRADEALLEAKRSGKNRIHLVGGGEGAAGGSRVGPTSPGGVDR